MGIKRFKRAFRQKKAALHADYFFVSYPKSGRTWVRYFLSQYYSKKHGIDIGMNFDFASHAHRHMPNILFTHTPSRALGFMSFFAKKDTLLLVRDPRDVIVSRYFQLTKRRIVEEAREETLPEFVENPEHGITDVIASLNRWYEHRASYARSFALFHYEALVRAPRDTFTEILASLGEQEISEEALSFALTQSDFEAMQEVERSQAENARLRPGDEADPESYKVRRGKVGGFRDYLPDATIQYMDERMRQLNPAFEYAESFKYEH